MIADLNTYLTKAIPDTKLTIEKYADAKFEYLVGCLVLRMRGHWLIVGLVVLFESERNGRRRVQLRSIARATLSHRDRQL